MNTPLPVRAHVEQRREWPTEGECILAHHDDDSLVVYQAYRPEIGEWAIRHGRLGGPAFSFNRMSWIKPNFLWMMYRSGWGTKAGQEITLGLRIPRRFFNGLLEQAVGSSFSASGLQGRDEGRERWQQALESSDVRLQWDPDHAPDGSRLQRRAVQLGLRGDALSAFARTEILEVIDMSAFVAAQRPHALTNDDPRLMTPVESLLER